jgi:hypothetical protein
LGSPPLPCNKRPGETLKGTIKGHPWLTNL